MLQGVMVTNGGPHPADKWADISAESILMLIQVQEDSVTPEAEAARQVKRDLRPKLFEALNSHHASLQDAERKAPKGLDEEMEVMADTLKTAAAVNKLLASTPYAAHFAKPEVQQVLVNIIGQHSTDVIHIERRWAADRAKGN